MHINGLTRFLSMSADFWAGYISGAAGILVGNPLDLIKTRLQAGSPSTTIHDAILPPSPFRSFDRYSSLVRGATAPILGYGALNALLFVTYNRSLSLLTSTPTNLPPTNPTYTQIYLAGFLGGLATFLVSAPTELIKVRAQLASPSPTSGQAGGGHTPGNGSPTSSFRIASQILRTSGIQGLYRGGVVTAARDAIGYGFYFVAYDAAKGALSRRQPPREGQSEEGLEAWKILLAGGFAGVITWASIFPLDVIKTRVQSQQAIIPLTPITHSHLSPSGEEASLLGANGARQPTKPSSTLSITLSTYREGGLPIFFRGLGVCSVRAFIVNAVQWAVYEWIMASAMVRKGDSTALDVL